MVKRSNQVLIGRWAVRRTAAPTNRAAGSDVAAESEVASEMHEPNEHLQATNVRYRSQMEY